MSDSPITLDLANFDAEAPTWRHPILHASSLWFFIKTLYHWKLDEAIFLNSDPDLDDDTNWRPARPLGRGGYGLVGLWEKLDENGNLLDSIAIKQQKYMATQEEQESLTVGGNGLSYEAELMHQLNAFDCPNIIKLKGFKDNEAERLWRYYFEFADFGNLHDLKVNYMAWNTYLPEEFLWHVFHSLATAGLALGDSDFHEYRDGTANLRLENWFVVHFDLKPQNVVLGKPVDKMSSHFSNYPVVKMMDFGLARITGPADPNNPSGYWTRATPGHKPPVRLSETLLWQASVDYETGTSTSDGSLATTTRG
jgi:serine/threonine protein kinase